MAVIEAYVTNLGKYNEGELASSLLKFPTTREEVQEVLKQIGIDNIRYEEIFIADYGGDLPELNHKHLILFLLQQQTFLPQQFLLL